MTTPRSRRPKYTTTTSFNAEELELLDSALDSHEYWELTESQDRNNAVSQVEDGESDEIDAVRALQAKLRKAQRRIKFDEVPA